MSVKVERRLRKRCKNDETPLKILKSVSSSSKRTSDFSLAVDFHSDSLSSTSPPRLQSDIESEKKVRRKVRCTQDINYLSSSLTSQDDEPTKTKSKRTKKVKRVYNLPNISRVADDWTAGYKHILPDYNYDQPMSEKNRSKKSKSTDTETYRYANCRNERIKKCKFSSEFEKGGKNLETISYKKIKCKQTLEKNQSSDEYQSANSTVSDTDNHVDSEVEIIYKNKKFKKKRNVANGNTALPNKGKINYTDRIKMLLNNKSFRKTRSGETSNSPLPNTPCDKKQENKSSNKRVDTKLIKTQSIPRMNLRKVSVASPKKYNDKQYKLSENSVSIRLSQKINGTPPHSKVKLCCSSYSLPNENQRCSKKSLTESLTFPEKGQINGRNTALTENVICDMDFDSDDVFKDTSQEQIVERQEVISDLSSNSTVNKKTRKSVRFQAPEQNIGRDTLLLSDDVTKLPRDDDIFENVSQTRLSMSGTDKRNSTFEVTSPKVINPTNSNQDLDQSQYNSRYNTPHEHLSKLPTIDSLKRKRERKCSTELISPVNKKSMDNKNITVRHSIIDLTTPVSTNKIDIVNQDILESKKSFHQSSLSKGYTVSENMRTVTEPTEIEENNSLSNASFSKNMPRLVRTATFTKDSVTVKDSPCVQSDLKYDSPLQINISSTKTIDTSKVNKRRRWDKSRLSVSFLDGSLDIKNISAPWEEGNSSRILDSSYMNVSKQDLELKYSPKVGTSKKFFKNCQTPPSGTSTPLLKEKTNLLRQTLSKDKENRATQVAKTVVPKILKTKIPNFALIHQRAFDKLENIKEMTERKAARAKLLLSGHKPPSENISKISSKRRELKFSSTHSFNENNIDFNKNLSESNISNTIRSLNNSSISKTINKSLNNSNISITKVHNISPSKSNPKVLNKENRATPLEKKKQLSKAKSQIPRSKLPISVIAEKKGFTRFGFKTGSENVKTTTKEEQVKAVADKTSVRKNTVEERRNMIQGVRSNRRFELLMKMRNK